MPLDKNHVEVFDPRAPVWRGKLWVRLVLPGGRELLYLFWRRILLLLFVILLGLWLGGAGAVRGFAAWRGVEGAAYLDLLWPGRWPRYEAALGEHYWAAARGADREGRLREVISLLRATLRYAPGNVEARRLLAIYYIRAGRPQFASECLALGLPGAASNLDYLKLLFGLLDEHQDDLRILALGEALLPASPNENLVELYLALQVATAHFNRGRYDQAETLVEQWNLGRSVEGQLLLARADWERGLTAEAIARLEQEEARFAGRDELARELLRFRRESGQDGAWRRQALLRVLALPNGPGPRVDWIASLRSTQNEGWAQEVERFFTDFGRDAGALVLLAWHAADVADPDLAARARALASEAGHSLNGFVLAEVQAAIAADQPGRALALATEATAVNTEGNPHFAPALAGLRALALYAAGDPERAEIELGVFANHNGTRAADSVWLARELRQRGADRPARRLLATAVELDPLNQAALTELIEVDADMGRFESVAVLVPRLLALRKPSLNVLREVAFKIDRLPKAVEPALRAALAKELDTK